jgi:phosphoglycerate dehydrogenase-like enzyme
VDVATVFRRSDFVTLNAPLTAETHGLVDARLLGMMQPTAFLINTARGGLVVQDDLVAALEAGKIAGAGLDVFAEEPLPADHPLTRMENVILAPHSLAWTDQLYRDNGVHACLNIVSVLAGEAPRATVNKDVLAGNRLQAKLAELRRRWEASVAG